MEQGAKVEVMSKRQLWDALIELDKLASTLGVVVNGCGCCGSPALSQADANGPELDGISLGGGNWESFLEEYPEELGEG
jgi:hypothetical protein